MRSQFVFSLLERVPALRVVSGEMELAAFSLQEEALELLELLELRSASFLQARERELLGAWLFSLPARSA